MSDSIPDGEISEQKKLELLHTLEQTILTGE